MKVTMKVQISGTRNGTPWPAPGGVAEVGDAEGADLCAGGLATPVADDQVEQAVAPADEESREDAQVKAAPKRRGRPAKVQPKDEPAEDDEVAKVEQAD